MLQHAACGHPLQCPGESAHTRALSLPCLSHWQPLSYPAPYSLALPPGSPQFVWACTHCQCLSPLTLVLRCACIPLSSVWVLSVSAYTAQQLCRCRVGVSQERKEGTASIPRAASTAHRGPNLRGKGVRLGLGNVCVHVEAVSSCWGGCGAAGKINMHGGSAGKQPATHQPPPPIPGAAGGVATAGICLLPPLPGRGVAGLDVELP